MYLIQRLYKPPPICFLIRIKPDSWVWGRKYEAQKFSKEKANELKKLIKSPTVIVKE